MKKCIILFSDGTEEIEALTPLDILRRAGVGCVLAKVPAGGKSDGLTAEGSHGIKVVCDRQVSEVKQDDFDMVIVPGGMPGTSNIGMNGSAVRLIEAAYESGRFVAAICAAPSLLGKLGMLEGRNAICYPGFEKELRGAKIADAKVVRDGNVITGAGMGVALDFALECVKALCGEETAKKLSAGVIHG